MKRNQCPHYTEASRCFARRYRWAWIETSLRPESGYTASVSPAGIGGRGLKPLTDNTPVGGNGVSPAGIGGRGLKHDDAGQLPDLSGFARRYRWAWIETGSANRTARGPMVSPAGIGGRGLKRYGVDVLSAQALVSPAGIGGRGLKLGAAGFRQRDFQVSPAGIGGRGLKRPIPRIMA